MIVVRRRRPWWRRRPRGERKTVERRRRQRFRRGARRDGRLDVLEAAVAEDEPRGALEDALDPENKAECWLLVFRHRLVRVRIWLTPRTRADCRCTTPGPTQSANRGDVLLDPGDSISARAWVAHHPGAHTNSGGVGLKPKTNGRGESEAFESNEIEIWQLTSRLQQTIPPTRCQSSACSWRSSPRSLPPR